LAKGFRLPLVKCFSRGLEEKKKKKKKFNFGLLFLKKTIKSIISTLKKTRENKKPNEQTQNHKWSTSNLNFISFSLGSEKEYSIFIQ
jgi:hypothetical protein